MIRHLFACAMCLFGVVCAAPAVRAANASELSLPASARQLSIRNSPLDSYAMPLAPFDGEMVPSLTFEGRIERQTWRVDGASLTTLQLLAPLREQIVNAGYSILFECESQACGGFDFRFGTEVIPAPDMHVVIRNYRFLSALRGESEALSILISASRSAAFIQLIHVAPDQQGALQIAPGNEPESAPVTSEPQFTGGLSEALVSVGHVILDDLVFQTGANKLGPGPYASLSELAGFLNANPDYRIALVGHTDSVGALAQNISLSKRRAGSVRERMIEQHGIAANRISAEGVGYLSPVASNLTAEGRDANRRVEAILLGQ